jgi:hypothetical protein
MVSGKIPKCNICGTIYPTWEDLARHIWSNKETHGKSKKFAAKVLASVNKREYSQRTPMSAEIKQIAKDTVREISGKTELVRTVCPNCKRVEEQKIEVEYLKDRAWRNSNGTLIVNCQGCRN